MVTPRSVTHADEELEALRRHGFGVAYRMLGTVAEAEDVAQEALLRLTRQERDRRAGRVDHDGRHAALDQRPESARARASPTSGRGCPSRCSRTRRPARPSRAELADSLSLALLVLLERLTPVERAAYLLREVFGYEYAEIAGIIEQTEVNSRQLVTRARKHLEASRPRFDPDEAARDALLERFLAAAEEGDLDALEELLAEDAVLYADGGGKAMAAQSRWSGAALIAASWPPWRRRGRLGALETRRVRVNGQPGRVCADPPRRGPERAYGRRRRRPHPGRAHRAQPGQARAPLSCHRAVGCAVRPGHMTISFTISSSPSPAPTRQSVPSTFAFAVRHSGVFWFRGSFRRSATLTADGEGLALDGTARVDSISIVEPDALRAHLLGPTSSTPSTTPRSRSARRDPPRRRSDRPRSRASSRSPASPAGSAPRATAPRRAEPATAKSRGWSCTRASTAASSASTGSRSCRAAATRSAGRST